MQLRSVLSRRSGFIVWALFLVAGLCSFQNYGISWDEEAQRYAAQISYDYIRGRDNFLLQWDNRDYGVVFELLLLGLEKLLRLTQLRDIYLMRHLVTHLFFLGGAWCFYLLLRRIFQSPFLAVTGLLLLLLHPRIYADSFYNSKDLPFLSMYAICLNVFSRAFDSERLIVFWMMGVVTGLLTDIRILGILFFASVLFFLFGQVCFNIARRKSVRQKLLQLTVYVLSSCLTVYLFWPFLWMHPLDGLLHVWKSMSVFSRWDASVFFNGAFIHSSKIPWYYLPVWIGITTPVFYVAAAIGGIILVSVSLLRKSLACFYDADHRLRLLALLTCLGPVLAVIVLHSVVYDAWRQVFFIYPAFVLLSVWALSELILFTRNNLILKSAIVFAVLSPLAFTISSFPLSNVYFNVLAGTRPDEIRHRWEMDYWGLSFRQGLNYILDHDTSSHIIVRYRESPCAATYRIFFAQDRRLELQHVEETDQLIERGAGDYFITNYRLFPNDFEQCKGNEIYSFRVANSRVCTIFKLR
ncbi:MAG: glycosyltransferase family 39 protein [Chitinophagaceae bacterium]